MPRPLRLLLVLGALGLSGAGSAQALRGHNTNAPVDVEADRIEVQDRTDRATFTGNVRVKQGDLNMSAQRINVAYANAAGSNVQVQRLDASGGVVVQSPSEVARGNLAIYDVDRRLITMLGGVSLTRGANVVNGGRLVIDLTSGRASVDGSAVAGAGGGVSSGRGGRVTGRFTVPQRAAGSN